MTKLATTALCAFALASTAACTPAGSTSPVPSVGDNPASGTRPADQPNEIVRLGVIEAGVECPILRTSTGQIYSLSLGDSAFGPGDYVRVTGELADASFCMQGEGTLIVLEIERAQPPG